jgi:ADP-ribosylglycohydrolase
VKRPLPNSYWVEPGRILAGEHPDGGSEAATRARIEALCAAGVRSFVDLTEAGELPDYREFLPREVTWHSFPFPDHSVPRSKQQMREVQQLLEKLMAAGTLVYVHCRAGIGRTGITIGCYLREQGESAAGVLAQLNQLWQQNARATRWPVIPETEEQEQFILNWDPNRLDVASLQGRYRGCLLGQAIADIAATTPASAAPVGWSAETALTHCAAESLLACGGFDGRDQVERIRQWVRDPAASGAALGTALPMAVRNVMARAVWNKAQVLGSHDPTLQEAPLARCAAAALFAAAGTAVAGEIGADLARITHQAPLPVEACRLVSEMMYAALRGEPQATVIAVGLRPDNLPRREEVRLLAQEWNSPQPGRRSPPAGVLGVLDRAVRSFARSRSFADGLERALAGRGAERSAVAATYGALAGAWYGEIGLPTDLTARVANPGRIIDLAGRMLRGPGAKDGLLA